MPLCVLQLPFGLVYKYYSTKWVLIILVAIFEIGSLVCALAPNSNALIVGRVLAGAGGTGIYLGGLNHFSALTTRHERGGYLAGTGFIWGLGAILGPVVGGSFADSSATWRWGFYINLILFAFIGPVLVFLLPSIGFAAG